MTKLFALIVLIASPAFAQSQNDLAARVERIEKVLSFIAPKQATVCRYKDKDTGTMIEGIGVARRDAKAEMLKDCETKGLKVCPDLNNWNGIINVMDANGSQLEAVGISCKDVPLSSLFE